MQLNDKAIKFFEDRGISGETAANHMIRTEGSNVIIFPFFENGKVVNEKSRTYEKKFWQKDGCPQIFWNHDVLLEDDIPKLVITEGEIDALSAIEAGFPHTVSVPGGAPAEVSEGPVDDTEGKFNFVYRAWDRLKRVEKFIIAVDGDEAGRCLAQELVRRFKPQRCFFITYPEGCKDLNDILVKHGAAEVARVLNGAKPYPVKGLYEYRELPREPRKQVFSTGWLEVDLVFKPFLGEFIVETGYPGVGKSTWNKAFMVNLAKLHGWHLTAAVFEESPQEFADGLIHCLTGIDPEYMNAEKYEKARAWVQRHFAFIAQTPSDDSDDMDLDFLLAAAEGAVVRYNTKFLLIDPWNEIEHKREKGETETDYVNRAIRTIKRFSKRCNVATMVVAHPAKPHAKETDLNLYSISGCYSDDTEVLTGRGWLRHSEIERSDVVACYDASNETLSYLSPSRIIKKRYSGSMFQFRGCGYDILVTPEHRMVVKPKWKEPVGSQKETGWGRPVLWEKGSWSFCEAQKLPSAPFVLPLAGDFCGHDTGISEDLARLAGWYVSEGTGGYPGVAISQGVGILSDQIEGLLVKLNIPFSVYKSGPGGNGGTVPMNSFYIKLTGAREIVNWLKKECGIGCKNKKIPKEIFEGLPHIRRAFLETYLLGDGSYDRERGAHRATTTSKVLRDQLQSLSVGLGYSCCWHKGAWAKKQCSDSWGLNIGTNGRRETGIRKYRNQATRHYDGYVWCLTVPTGAYVIRRNGKATICGNSAHWANKCDVGIVLSRQPDSNTLRGDIKKPRFRKTAKVGGFYLYHNPVKASYEGMPDEVAA